MPLELDQRTIGILAQCNNIQRDKVMEAIEKGFNIDGYDVVEKGVDMSKQEEGATSPGCYFMDSLGQRNAIIRIKSEASYKANHPTH